MNYVKKIDNLKFNLFIFKKYFTNKKIKDLSFKNGFRQFNTSSYLLTKKAKSKKGKSSQKGFRISARSLFLTYSNLTVNLSEYPGQNLHNEILKQLLNKKEFDIKDHLICVELHQNGIPHAHVLLILNKKCDTTNSRALDLFLEDRVFHGEYEITKSQKKAIEYISKDKNYITNMKFEIYENKVITPEQKAFLNCKIIGQKKALENYVAKYPERAFTRLSGLKNTLKNLEWVLKPEEHFVEPKFTLNSLRYKSLSFKAKMLFLAKNNLFNRTPILFGSGGEGKTLLLKALMKALEGRKLLIRNKEQTINLIEEHDVLGYDEFNIEQFNDQDFINLLDEDEESVIRILYNTVKKKKGLKIILGTNKIKNILKKEETLAAILRRTIFIKVDKENKIKYPKRRKNEENIKIDIDLGEDFKIEEYIENIENYEKYHHYSNKHPLTIANYKILGLTPPEESDSEEE